MLWTLAATALVIYAAIGTLSLSFDVAETESQLRQRPLLTVLWLFAAAYGVYFGAVAYVFRARDNSSRTLTAIIASSLIFRIILLFSTPIQEIDIYRYLWDGIVSTEGVSPFRYSPQQVLEASEQPNFPADGDLQRFSQSHAKRSDYRTDSSHGPLW